MGANTWILQVLEDLRSHVLNNVVFNEIWNQIKLLFILAECYKIEQSFAESRCAII
jgi:hypothetical protein